MNVRFEDQPGQMIKHQALINAARLTEKLLPYLSDKEREVALKQLADIKQVLEGKQ